MVDSDFESACQQYKNFLLDINSLVELAEKAAWDELDSQLPSIVATMQQLVVVNPDFSVSQKAILADLMTQAQSAIIKLEPLLVAWRDELSKLLQGMTNEARLFNAYGA